MLAAPFASLSRVRYTVQAMGIATLIRAEIASNMADFHEKSTQKTRL